MVARRGAPTTPPCLRLEQVCPTQIDPCEAFGGIRSPKKTRLCACNEGLLVGWMAVYVKKQLFLAQLGCVVAVLPPECVSTHTPPLFEAGLMMRVSILAGLVAGLDHDFI